MKKRNRDGKRKREGGWENCDFSKADWKRVKGELNNLKSAIPEMGARRRVKKKEKKKNTMREFFLCSFFFSFLILASLLVYFVMWRSQVVYCKSYPFLLSNRKRKKKENRKVESVKIRFEINLSIKRL